MAGAAAGAAVAAVPLRFAHAQGQKLKNCADLKRIAVVSPDDLDGPINRSNLAGRGDRSRTSKLLRIGKT